MIEGFERGAVSPSGHPAAAEATVREQYLDPKRVAEQLGTAFADSENTVWDAVVSEIYPGDDEGEDITAEHINFVAYNNVNGTYVESMLPYSCVDDEQHAAALRRGEASIEVTTKSVDDGSDFYVVASPNNTRRCEEIVSAVLDIDEGEYDEAFAAAEKLFGEGRDLTFDDFCYVLKRTDLIGTGNTQRIFIPDAQRQRLKVLGETSEDLETHDRLRQVVTAIAVALASRAAQEAA